MKVGRRLIEEAEVLAEGLDTVSPRLLKPLTFSCSEDDRETFRRGKVKQMKMKRMKRQGQGGCELSPTDTSSLLWAPSSTGVPKINTPVRLTSFTSPPDLSSSHLFHPHVHSSLENVLPSTPLCYFLSPCLSRCLAQQQQEQQQQLQQQTQ